MEGVEIIDTTVDNILNYGVCGYKNINKAGYPEKIAWLKDRFSEGLKIKTVHSIKDGTQGMIEYIPGEYCWRPVEADKYMFIHCIFVGFKHAYKGKGYGSLLLQSAVEDAKSSNMLGIATVTRNGSFMAGKDLFIKNNFTVVDRAPPDFELVVYKFNQKAPSPKFKDDMEQQSRKYGKGITIIRANQCPYTVKNVREISETAEKSYGITPTLIELKSYKEAQNGPCAFGSFCILYNGTVIAYHPISNKRFTNIMNKMIS
jgi:GNAT superfamily N-acetyltransferase